MSVIDGLELDDLYDKNKEMRDAILAYLEWSKDVGVSPTAPELRAIREALRKFVS